MKEIRAATLDAHTLVTHRRMPLDMAERYRVRVKHQVDSVRSASARPSAAAAALEPVLGDIERGADAVAGRGNGLDPIGGIIAIDEALASYGAQFDDPGWQPLR